MPSGLSPPPCAERYCHHGQPPSAQSGRGQNGDRDCQSVAVVAPSPYSPDLNPIEMVFAKLKALLRKASERTVGKLWDRIGELLQAFSSQKCENYLIHQGYSAT